MVSSFTAINHLPPLFVLVFGPSEAIRSSLLFIKNCKRESTFELSWKFSIKILSRAGFNLITSIKNNGLWLVEGDSGIRIT